jgi:hypothetical protein
LRDGALSGQPRRSKYPTYSDPRNALPEPPTAHGPDYAHYPGQKFRHTVGTLFCRGAFLEIDSPNLRWSACNLLPRPSTRGGVISPEGGCKANSIACGCECQNSRALCQCPDVRNCAESGCPKPATPSLIRKASAYTRRRALKNERTFSYRRRSADSRLRRRLFLLWCALEGMESPNTAARLMTPAMQKSGRGLSCVKRRMRFFSQASRQNCSASATGSSTRVSIRRWPRRPSRTPPICPSPVAQERAGSSVATGGDDRAAAGRDASRLNRGRTWMSRHDGQTGTCRG